MLYNPWYGARRAKSSDFNKSVHFVGPSRKFRKRRLRRLVGLFGIVFAALATAQTPTSQSIVPVGRDPESILVDLADREDKIQYIASYATFEYGHDRFGDHSQGDSMLFHWLQSFGPSKRLAAGIEFPVIYESLPGAAGIGDVMLEFRGMLSKGEKFEHAAVFQITVPSGTRQLIDDGHILDGQTILTLGWGCSAHLAEHTEVSLELHYNKAVHSRTSDPKRNYLEPQLIVSQGIMERLAGYLEWNQYYEYSKRLYVPLLKPGLTISLGREHKWSISPYVDFPLNRNARIEETKLGAGAVLSYTF
jgi:hypothetical protein